MRNIEIIEGPGGLPCVEIANKSGRALISLYGAHVISYAPAGEKEVLMVSRESHYTYGKAIRGGIPVCWPWFSAHPTDASMPAHGFARIHSWAISDVKYTTAGDGSEKTTAVFILPRQAYANNFELQAVNLKLTVSVGTELEVTLETENISEKDFTYSCALHTYFSVGDIADTTLTGLENEPFFNSLTGETGKGPVAIAFTEEYDRIYFSGATCIINDNANARKIVVAKKNSGSTVVWNPWIAKSARMSDFGNEEYRKMLCVETACVKQDSRTVPPGGTSSHSVTISVTR